jgi:hypothetical protein
LQKRASRCRRLLRKERKSISILSTSASVRATLAPAGSSALIGPRTSNQLSVYRAVIVVISFAKIEISIGLTDWIFARSKISV